ncbi:hypothetical protein PSCICO_28460 [Pseudomonas cichorii]|nr:hypothetical protein PSCICO_28460 [Pseudomonas cichorii]
MVDVVEGMLTFSFDDEWQVIKFDESQWYCDRMKRQLKGMDILAIKDERHWWIEIKDCLGYEPANIPRMSGADPSGVTSTKEWLAGQSFAGDVKVQRQKLFIIDEVMQKFRDTLASVVIAQREGDQELRAYVAPIKGNPPLVVVLLLTWEPREYGRLAARLKLKLDMALKPYGLTGFVVNETCRVPGLDPAITRAP